MCSMMFSLFKELRRADNVSYITNQFMIYTLSWLLSDFAMSRVALIRSSTNAFSKYETNVSRCN